MAQRYGFLCCGPSAERNVYYSSDEDSEDEMGLADARIVNLPEENLDGGASHDRQPLIDARGNSSAGRVPGRVALVPLPEEPSFLDRLAENWKNLQVCIYVLGVEYNRTVVQQP